MNDHTALELDFHKEMLAIYHNAKRDCAFNPVRFLQMVANDGGVLTAKKILGGNQPQAGFVELWECGRLDLTMEYLVMKPKYQQLFTLDEIAIARTRLAEHGFNVNNIR